MTFLNVPQLRLRHLAGPRRGQEVIVPGPRLRIGRSRDNDLILPESESPTSSAHHAEARFESGQWWIVDLGSTNGTLLNDTRVSRERLRTGDRLKVGDDVLLLVDIRTEQRAWIVVAAAACLIALGAAYLLYRPHRRSFEEIAAAAAQSVYLIAIDDGGHRSVVGTGFAVAANGVLATNAHIADELRRRDAIGHASGPIGVAVRGDVYEATRISRVTVHPNWQPESLANDVALLELAGARNVAPLPLAEGAAVDRLRRGVTLAALGFPGASTDPWKPRGRLSVDVLGDVRSPYLEVGLAISPGTSGSPVFTDDGAVVAIVIGGDFVEGPDGRGKHPSGTAANWAISISVLRDILASKR